VIDRSCRCVVKSNDANITIGIANIIDIAAHPNIIELAGLSGDLGRTSVRITKIGGCIRWESRG